MVNIGQMNRLEVLKQVDFGYYLDGGEDGEILIPQKYVPEDIEIGGEIDVFVYPDSEDRLIATTETPLAMVGDFAWLKVKEVNNVGAFLDWGLLKDLLVPYSEQKKEMKPGLSYLVFIYLDDETERVVASTKINLFLDNVPAEYYEGQQVDLIIGNPTDLGFNVIINGLHSGLIYSNEIFQPIKPGEKLKGFVRKIREDEKIDVELQKSGGRHIDDSARIILDKLKSSGGYLEVNDKSSPETIKHVFGISKKVFKKAIGGLYKSRKISIEENGIRLLSKKNPRQRSR